MKKIKGTGSVISSVPPCKESNKFINFRHIIYTWLVKALKGTVVNLFMDGDSLENAYSPFEKLIVSF